MNPLKMTDEQKIKSLLAWETSTVWLSDVVNGHTVRPASIDRAMKDYCRKTKIVLTLLLGRTPTEEELSRVTNG